MTMHKNSTRKYASGGMPGNPMMAGGVLPDGRTVPMMGGATYARGGTVLSSNKVVQSTHDHLMRQGLKNGYKPHE